MYKKVMRDTIFGLLPAQINCHFIQDQTCHDFSSQRKGCWFQGKFSMVFFFRLTELPNSESGPRVRALEMEFSLQKKWISNPHSTDLHPRWGNFPFIFLTRLGCKRARASIRVKSHVHGQGNKITYELPAQLRLRNFSIIP